MEPPFDELPGVISTTSGDTGGRTKNPTYEQVSSAEEYHQDHYKKNPIRFKFYKYRCVRSI
jgi:peptide-methionine (S)-S-oxide reductase